MSSGESDSEQEEVWSDNDEDEAKTQFGGAKKASSALCLDTLLESYDITAQRSTSASQSAFVFGKLNPEVLRTTTTRECVVKLSLPSSPDDNSLEAEGKLYMLIRKEVVPYTPHILGGLFDGVCSDRSLMAFKNSSDPQKVHAYGEWFGLRLNREWKTMSKKRRDELGAEMDARKMDATFENIAKFGSVRFKPTQMHMVVTPRIGDVYVEQFFLRPEWELARSDISESDILCIVLQMAQMLSVLARKQIVHNDAHMQNIFLRKLPTPQQFAYTKPLKAVMRSRMEIMAYDLDRGAALGAGIRNTLLDKICPVAGECNQYQKNFDWYMFLTKFTAMLEDAGFRVPKAVSSLLRDADQETDAAYGHACKCVERLPDADMFGHQPCKRCKMKRAYLESMETPADFFSAFARSERGKKMGMFV